MRRSNPGPRAVAPDCFAALAMTEELPRQSTLGGRLPRSAAFISGTSRGVLLSPAGDRALRSGRSYISLPLLHRIGLANSSSSSEPQTAASVNVSAIARGPASISATPSRLQSSVIREAEKSSATSSGGGPNRSSTSLSSSSSSVHARALEDARVDFEAGGRIRDIGARKQQTAIDIELGEGRHPIAVPLTSETARSSHRRYKAGPISFR